MCVIANEQVNIISVENDISLYLMCDSVFYVASHNGGVE